MRGAIDQFIAHLLIKNMESQSQKLTVFDYLLFNKTTIKETVSSGKKKGVFSNAALIIRFNATLQYIAKLLQN